MIKLTSIIPSIYGGGAEKLASDLSVYLSDEHDHTTYTYNEVGIRLPYKGKVIDLKISKSKSILGRLVRQFRIIRSLRINKLVNKTEVSISHMFMSNICNILSSKRDTTICVLHGEWCARTHSNFILEYVTKQIYKRADSIVTVSDYIKDLFIEYHGNNHKISVIHNGIDLEAVASKSNDTLPEGLPKEYLLMVGAMRPEKEYLLMLDHIKPLLKEKEISLVILGDGGLRSKIEQKIDRLGLNDRVILMGNVTNPYPIMKSATMMLLTSRTESFSLVLVEAMLLGTPVVATDCGGPGEILNPSNEELDNILITDYGVLLPTLDQLDTSQYAETLIDLLQDKAQLEKLSYNAHIRAKDFSIKASADKYLELIKEMTH